MAEEEEKREVERKQQEEEERKWWAEAALEVEWELREQGWRLDESLEEFWQCQRREEKQKEVDMEDWGPCLGCRSRKMESTILEISYSSSPSISTGGGGD